MKPLGEMLLDECLFTDDPHTNRMFDMREALGKPEVARRTGRALSNELLKKDCDQVVGDGFGAYPVVGAITNADSSIRGGMIRKRRKGYDRNRLVEGPLDHSKPCVIVDDLANTGRGARLAIRKCREEGFRVVGVQVVSILSESEEIEEKMEKCGVWFDSLFQFN